MTTMRMHLLARLLAASLTAAALPAGALTLGMVDTFQGGTTQGWGTGAANSAGPTLVSSGGPAGAGDSFLSISATGLGGPGGKLVAINDVQWAGNYLAAGITAVAMDLINLGSTDLSLRLALFGSTGIAVTTQAVNLPAGSGWTHALLAIDAGSLTGGVPGTLLGGVTEMRLFHASGAAFPGPNIHALVGVDNLSAVPEPGSAPLLLAGLGLGGLLWRRRSAALALATLGGAAQATTVLPAITHGDIAIGLQAVATGLSAPDYAIYAPGDTSRLFVVEQNGLLRVIQNGSLLSTPALDISARVAPPLVVTNANDERGFLGLAFHPDYAAPGSAGYHTLYTYNSEVITPSSAPTFVAPNGAAQTYKNVVNEWKMGSDGVVDPGSRREIVSFGKNAANHNGGTITFGTDGLLYLGLGDGGNANDVGPSHLEPGGNAQNLGTPLGKMLRIDPLAPALTAGSGNAISSNGQYRIPSSNPFQGTGQVAEIYAYGLRNPYRFSVDRTDLGGNGQIIIGDVGQNTVEEIDRLILGGNYGWGQKEGTFLFNRTTGAGGAAGTIGANSPGGPAGLIDPITGTDGVLEYDHGDGISITGGFIYRGHALPQLYGKYIFGDLALHPAAGGQPRADGRLFYADLDTGVIKEFLLPQFGSGQLPSGLTVHGFGEDASGELYALVTNTSSSGTGGIVYMLTSAVPEPATWASMGLGLLVLGAAVRRRPKVGSA
jgi:glucose/arabinose dehydrogenase